MGRLRSLASTSALLLGSLLACLGGLELLARGQAARVAAARATAPETPLARYHATLGWENSPGASQHLSRADFSVTVAFNAHGLRGPERPLEKPAGNRRVLILGDSFAAGYYAEEPETARARLEALLTARAQGGLAVDVLNAGTPGYSTDQEYLFYLERGRGLGASVVLLFFYCNDLHFNTTAQGTGGKLKPWFSLLSRTEIQLEGSPVPQAPELAPRDSIPSWRGSAALALLARRTQQGNPPLHRRLASLGLVPPLGGDPPPDFLPFAERGRQERWAVDDMWNRTRAILGKLNESVVADGARLVVVYVPARIEVNDDAWRWVRSRYAADREWKRDAVFDRLVANALPLGIEVVDPRAPLRAAESSQLPAYLPIDGHWNALGNEIVATLLAPRVQALLEAPAPR